MSEETLKANQKNREREVDAIKKLVCRAEEKNLRYLELRAKEHVRSFLLLSSPLLLPSNVSGTYSDQIYA